MGINAVSGRPLYTHVSNTLAGLFWHREGRLGLGLLSSLDIVTNPSTAVVNDLAVGSINVANMQAMHIVGDPETASKPINKPITIIYSV